MAIPAEQVRELLDEHPRYRWWVLASVIVVNVVVPGISWNYVIIVVPELLGDLGLPIDRWGILWSAIAFGVLAFSIPAGGLGDRFGARRAVASGVALIGVSLLFRAAATGLVSALLSMILFGMAMALIFASLAKAIAMWFPPEELGMANGVSQAGIGLGFGIATLTTPLLLAQAGGWRPLTGALACLAIALSAVWLMAIRDRSTAAAPEGSGAAVGTVLRVRDMRLIALCNFFYFGAYLGVVGYLPTYFTTVQGMSVQAAGGVATVGAWSFIAGAILLPTLSDRIGRRKLVYVAGILANGIVVFSEAYLLGVPLALAAMTWGLVAGAVVLLFVVPVELPEVGPALAASATGVINAAGFGGGVVLPLVGMLLVRVTPVLGFAFWAACYVASALLFTAVRETGSRPA
jgi:nitrate/nitrite transporter NarK